MPLTPDDLPSFMEALQPSTVEHLLAMSPFDDYLHPIFGTYRFPIDFHESSSLPLATREAILTDLFANRAELSLEDCHQYNQNLATEGFNYRVPLSLRGICTKDKATCKVFKRWHCGGCGRVFLPGSLNDPACKVGEYPWWYVYMQVEVQETIRQHGGVSKSDPLIWFPVGAKRHGRLTQYDPTQDE